MKNKKNETNDETKKSGLKGGTMLALVVILAFVASAAGVVVSGKYFTGHADESKTTTVEDSAALAKKQRLVNVKKFIVNLTGDNAAEPQYLRLKVSLLVANDEQAQLVKKRMPVVRDSVIQVLKPKKATDLLQNNVSLDQLKEQIKQTVNRSFGSSVVQEVYITDFVIQ